VLCAGTLDDCALIGRRVANRRQITCASLAYLRKYGEPPGHCLRASCDGREPISSPHT
jgi:hypothetical protein